MHETEVDGNMGEVPLFSIIVPVYNTGQLLRGCVESILGQGCGDFELILVDDGSTDDSSVICDDFAEKESRVVCIHQPNGGVSSARNAGLDRARGRYVWFCDSDDAIYPGALDELRACIEGSAPLMVVFPDEEVDSDGRQVGIIPAPAQSRSKDDGPLQCGDKLYPHVHVFDRRLAEGERFDTSLVLLEDRDFFYRIAWKAAGSTAIIDKPLYRYLVTREDSAVNSTSLEKVVASSRVEHEIFLNEERLGKPMPAFGLFAAHSVWLMSIIVRDGGDDGDFEFVRARLAEYEERFTLLGGVLKARCVMAVEAPKTFKFLAKVLYSPLPVSFFSFLRKARKKGLS